MVGVEIADSKGRVRISNRILQSEHHRNVVVVGQLDWRATSADAPTRVARPLWHLIPNRICHFHPAGSSAHFQQSTAGVAGNRWQSV